MKYLLLIYDQETEWERLGPEKQLPILLEYRRLRDELTAAGQFIDGSQLHPTSMATAVRMRDGKRLVTDGPFAETREQLGGYFLIEAADLDAAIAVAARIPSARMGTVEVRPLVTPPVASA